MSNCLSYFYDVIRSVVRVVYVVALLAGGVQMALAAIPISTSTAYIQNFDSDTGVQSFELTADHDRNDTDDSVWDHHVRRVDSDGQCRDYAGRRDAERDDRSRGRLLFEFRDRCAPSDQSDVSDRL